ncbi:MAG: MmgE/PrpD family protein, partial [Thermomicrobia bacterium]|nr:MmgE/PrpD family protein [Thermomicrobia bacterium]
TLLGVSDDAALFPRGRSSAAGAAFANGVASHILEFDDVHKGATMHAAAPILPAAFAVAERAHADGRALLRATVLGYEVGLRVGEAVNPSHYAFWHPTGTAATFGAAVAAGTVLGLDATQMRDALGSAGTQAAGLWEFNADGAMSKHLHPGKAAMNGILAADLAQRGFTAATRILEGERGFFRAMSSDSDASRITERLGDQWKITENCYKLHSCCGHTHTAIDTAQSLRAQQGWQGDAAVQEIATIEIALYGPGYDIVRRRIPHTPYQAKFSVAYCVAAALVEGVVGLAQFDADRFAADGVQYPPIAALLERTTVRVDPALTTRYPEQWPARVTIHLTNGETIEGNADYPRGNPENPVPFATLEAKCRSLIAPRYDAALADQVIVAGQQTRQGIRPASSSPGCVIGRCASRNSAARCCPSRPCRDPGCRGCR